MQEEIAARLRTYIRERFEIPADDPDFTDNTDLFNYGYIDSFGAVDLTKFVEEAFSISVSDADWTTRPMSTVKDLSTFILKRQKREI